MVRLFKGLIVLPILGCPAGFVEDAEPPAVAEFGYEDQRVLTVVGTEADGLNVPRDLEFNPYNPEQLWVVNRADDSMSIFFDAGLDEQDSEWRKDVYASHFMEEVSSLSFGAEGTYSAGDIGFGTCHESRNTYDGTGSPNDFMGPTLWPGGLEHFAAVNQSFGSGLQGSHLDMLHESPNCMGIVHEEDNAYWVFDGKKGQLVYYDFQVDHGLGMDDHSDGIVRRYVDVELSRVADVPGHMVRDETGLLYIANTGDGTILRVDPSTAEESGRASGAMEPLAEYTRYTGSVVEEFASGLDEPSGLVLLDDGRLFVSEYASGDIVAFDADGNELDRMDAKADGLMGLELGPDGFLWFVDADTDRLIRVDP